MANTRLIKITDISQNSNPRNNSISRITIHITASSNNFPITSLLSMMRPLSFAASYNYAVGTDGRVGMSVEENRRAWSTGNHDNDDRAINIGVINNSQGPNWTTSEAAVSTTIDLCVDICIRNGISSLSWVNNGSTQGNMTAHSFFANRVCPGPFLMDRMLSIRDTVNTRLTESRNQAAGVTAAANRLRDEGVLNTPTFWINNFHAIQFLGGLIIAMANAPKNATPVTITTVDAAIDRLASRGIINSPQYWRDNQGRLEHLGELLIAVARRVP